MIKGALIYHFFLFSLVPVDDVELETREGEEEPLFIPFPFTTRRLKQQPYSRGDPEVAEFFRIVQDPGLMKDIECKLRARTFVTFVADDAVRWRCPTCV